VERLLTAPLEAESLEEASQQEEVLKERPQRTP
jgi:hypothetical protein